MYKSSNEIIYLQKRINQMIKNADSERLMIECRKYGLPSAYAIEIIKYIIPDAKQNSRVPTIIVKWINDEYLLDNRNKDKYLKRIPDDELKKYKKYRVGREIKVRYRFKEESRKYQDIRLSKVYCLGLLKYLRANGY